MADLNLKFDVRKMRCIHVSASIGRKCCGFPGCMPPGATRQTLVHVSSCFQRVRSRVYSIYVPCLIRKTCQPIFYAYSYMNRFKYKLSDMSRKKHLTKQCKECLLHIKYVLALPLKIWGDKLSRQRFNESLNSHQQDWQSFLENHQTCSKLHHLYNTCSKYPPPVCTEISDVDKLRRRFKNDWTVWITLLIKRVVGDVAPASIRACVRAGSRHFEHMM